MNRFLLPGGRLPKSNSGGKLQATRRSLVQRHNLAKIALDILCSVGGNSDLIDENTQSG
jgi:hypothetical protein